MKTLVALLKFEPLIVNVVETAAAVVGVKLVMTGALT